MCLIVKDFKIIKNKSSFSLKDVVKISDEDMYVYKRFNRRYDKNGYHTPYRGYKISDQGDIMVEDTFS